MASCNIAAATRAIYDKFNGIRGRSKEEISFRFWDVVVLTASDDDQKFAFECQLSGKLKRKEIPLGLPYLVFADPPGPKIGCGGATMNVIHQLSKIYGSKLDGLLVLVINAGGQSQRLPNASVLGKIFTVLPFGEPPWQLFELKLACYLPFLQRMNSGFFHAASDTIEIFDVGPEESLNGDWDFLHSGLTALAHPSSLSIGTTHGVFVLENKQSRVTKPAEFRKCLEVLQKPDVSLMFAKGAVVKNEGSVALYSALEDFVYTDSCFFFDHSMAQTLLKFYLEIYPLQCEIDGYGDFMQSLGLRATDEFARDLRNVSKVEPLLIETRKKLFLALKETELHIIALNCSSFYHLGTMKECLENFDTNSELANCIGFLKIVFSAFYPSSNSESIINNGCIIHSIVSVCCKIGNRSIIEYCDLNGPLVIGDDCLVSNCAYRASDDCPSLHIATGLLLHTLELQNDGDKPRCVTLVLHVNDNVKKKVNGPYSEILEMLTFLEKPLSNVITQDCSDVFAMDINDEIPTYSLWHARIFPVTETKESSFLATLDLVRCVLDGGLNKITLEYSCISAFEAMQLKDVQKMVDHRAKLFNDIESFKEH